MGVVIKSAEEIEKMRLAGRLTAKVLEAVSEYIKPGITTMQIDEFCENYIVDTLKAIPGSKGQYGYPYSVNTSVNKEICHGVPSEKVVLKKGDIVNVDITVIADGYFGDSSKMFCIGKVSAHAKRLVDVTQECLYESIKKIRPGILLSKIGQIIEKKARENNYSVVEEYCGHGIGRAMHEDPQVVHYDSLKPTSKSLAPVIELQSGMVFTIEPMINQGKKHVKHKRVTKWPTNVEVSPNFEWDIASTKDGMLSAQWEHTILVTPNGFEVLTLRQEEHDVFANIS